LTQPALGFPTEVLATFGRCFESQLQVSPARGGIAVGPGAFAQGAAGLGVTRFGKRSLLARRTGGLCRGDPTQAFQQLSWGIDTGALAKVGHHGHGHGARHAAQGLQGFDYGRPAPPFDLVLKCLGETRESCGRFVHGTAICLQDDGRRRCGTNHLRAPPQVGRAPAGPARVADSVSEQEGLETERGGLKSTEGVCTCPGEIATGFICDCGDIDRSEIPRAGQPGQWHGVSAVGCDPIPRFWGHQRGGHHPAIVAFGAESSSTL